VVFYDFSPARFDPENPDIKKYSVIEGGRE